MTLNICRYCMVVRVFQIVRFTVQKHLISCDDVRRDDRGRNRTHEIRGSNPLSSTRRNAVCNSEELPRMVAGLFYLERCFADRLTVCCLFHSPAWRP